MFVGLLWGGRKRKIRFRQDKCQSQAMLACSWGREPKEDAHSTACFCLPRGTGKREVL